MERIDAHQHFWHYDPHHYDWIDSTMEVLKRDYLPKNLNSELIKSGVAGTVAVQALQSEKETEFLLELARKHSFIKGVVGWVDLRASNLENRLSYFSEFPGLKGLRHVLQDQDPDFMLQRDFQHGLKQLSAFGYTYDLLVYPMHFSASCKLVSKLPNQKFVLDHIGKPNIEKGAIKQWQKGLSALAQYPNVYCKLSGMVTEGSWHSWKIDDFEPYIEAVLEAFGTSRIMFGSDWPVCTLAASYEQITRIVSQFTDSLSDEERNSLWSKNAREFYNLKIT